MLTGEVTPDKEAVVRLSIHNTNGQAQEISAIVDTGFTEHLTLPSALVATLHLPFSYSVDMTLADGSTRIFPVHTLRLNWQDQVLEIPVQVTDGTPLIGMSLLYGSSLSMRILDGGAVAIEAI